MELVTVTSEALDQLKLALTEDAPQALGVRVGVQGGGCSGYTYVLEFTEEEMPGDWIQEVSGVKVYVDPMSAPYIRGTTLDFVTSLMGAGFKFSNPNSVRTCGCGSSFSV